jgi:hypothetical protein
LHHIEKMDIVGQFTGGIVRNIELIVRRPLGRTRIVRAAKAAHKAVERRERSVEQLLVFSRCRVMQPSTLDFNRVLLEFESLIRLRRSSVEETRLSSTLCSQGSGSA